MTEDRALRIYLITRTDEVDYEEDAAAVVAAYSRKEARQLAAGGTFGPSGRGSFLDPTRSTLTQIGVHVSAHGGKPAEPHVVLVDNKGM
mgnify:CR=1 FL=1